MAGTEILSNGLSAVLLPAGQPVFIGPVSLGGISLGRVFDLMFRCQWHPCREIPTPIQEHFFSMVCRGFGFRSLADLPDHGAQIGVIAIAIFRKLFVTASGAAIFRWPGLWFGFDQASAWGGGWNSHDIETSMVVCRRRGGFC
jgi:hypothetical protein